MKKLLFFIALIVLVPVAAQARLGVGVGLGKIQADEPLRAGGIYHLATIPVLNTGTESSYYSMSVQYHEGVFPRPEKSWLVFSPDTFKLEPGEKRDIDVSLRIPINAQPGDYFSYLEASPNTTITSTGGASVGVAAATKLYFTVTPGTWLHGLGYRALAIWRETTPWNIIVLCLIVVALIVRYVKKHFHFNIHMERRTTGKRK